MNIADYKTLIFDCDGVVLNSNLVKTEAFYSAALPYGDVTANAFVDYHVAHGGVSRYKKFEWFLREVVQGQVGPDLQALLNSYSNDVRHGLLTCDLADGLHELRDKTKGARWLIVSGGDQNELRGVFGERGLADLFDGGIFGSPDPKDLILRREMAVGNVVKPAIFLGDSKYDFMVALEASLDFIFMTKWTEFNGWEAFFSDKEVDSVFDIRDLLI